MSERLIDRPDVIMLQAQCSVGRLTDEQWEELKVWMDELRQVKEDGK